MIKIYLNYIYFLYIFLSYLFIICLVAYEHLGLMLLFLFMFFCHFLCLYIIRVRLILHSLRLSNNLELVHFKEELLEDGLSIYHYLGHRYLVFSCMIVHLRINKNRKNLISRNDDYLWCLTKLVFCDCFLLIIFFCLRCMFLEDHSIMFISWILVMDMLIDPQDWIFLIYRYRKLQDNALFCLLLKEYLS